MTQLNLKLVVDNLGNIQVHGRAGISLTFQRLQDNVAQDISGDDLYFEISGYSRVALGTVSGDPTTRTIIVEPEVIVQIPLNTRTPFALRDETSDPAVVRWDGIMFVRGYNQQPT